MADLAYSTILIPQSQYNYFKLYHYCYPTHHLNPHHTSARMSQIAVRIKSCIFFDNWIAFLKFWRHSMCIPYIRAHSWDWQEFAHVKNFRGAFEVEEHRMALEVYSTCTLAAFWIFLQHSTHSDPIREKIKMASHFESCPNVPSVSQMSRNASWMHLNCCRNLIPYKKNSAGMHFKCRQQLSIATQTRLECSRKSEAAILMASFNNKTSLLPKAIISYPSNK